MTAWCRREVLPITANGCSCRSTCSTKPIAGLPADRIRYHVCWGSWPGPHTSDVPLKDIVDLILGMKVGALVIENANPRHEHEWRVWETAKLRQDQVLIPGVISHATNVVEHPELVAERIVRIAKLVGRENLLAGTDCGFAQGPFYRRVHPSIMWAKLDALAQGAKLASKQLWALKFPEVTRHVHCGEACLPLAATASPLISVVRTNYFAACMSCRHVQSLRRKSPCVSQILTS